MVALLLAGVVVLWAVATLVILYGRRTSHVEIDQALSPTEPVVRPLEVVGAQRRRGARAA